MNFLRKGWRESISSQLLKSIFGIYFIVAIVVTLGQIGFEVRNVRNDIMGQLKNLELSFGKSLQKALWTEDMKGLKAALHGVSSNDFIKGLVITNEDGQEIQKKGRITNLEGVTILDKLFSHSFDIKSQGGDEILGRGEFFSSNRIIYNRIKYSLILIVLNSIIKTSLLWLIMIVFIKKYLERPLEKLKEELNELNLDDIKKIDYVSSKKNQFSLLVDAYNDLLERLKSYRDQIVFNQENLKSLVQRKTQELEEAVVQSRQNSNVKEQFLANISHEVRTPLNGIIGIGEILESKSDLTDEERLHFTQDLKQSARNLLLLLDNIIELSKINTNKIILENNNFNLRALGAELLSMFESQAKEKGCSLNVVFQDGLPEQIFFDRKKLMHALFGFLHNSVKFTQFGEIGIKFFCAHRCEEGEECNLIIEVYDTGIGIPKEELSRILDPFVQKEGQDINEYSGTGIGLSISDGIIKAMNGSIEVESEVGKGTKFTINLPQVKFISTNLEDSNEEINDVEGIKFSKAKVLLVEDEVISRNILESFLRSLENIEVFIAEDGEEGINIAKKEKPDLMIIDFYLPKLNGDLLAEQTKKEKLCETLICITRDNIIYSNPRIKYFDKVAVKPLDKFSLIKLLANFLKYEVIQKKDEDKVSVEYQEELQVLNQESFDQKKSELVDLVENAIESNTLNDIEDTFKSLNEFCVMTKWKPLNELKEDYSTALSQYNMKEVTEILLKIQKLLEEIDQKAA